MQSVLCEQSHDGYRACVKARFQTQSHEDSIKAVGHRLQQRVFTVFVSKESASSAFILERIDQFSNVFSTDFEVDRPTIERICFLARSAMFLPRGGWVMEHHRSGLMGCARARSQAQDRKDRTIRPRPQTTLRCFYGFCSNHPFDPYNPCSNDKNI